MLYFFTILGFSTMQVGSTFSLSNVTFGVITFSHQPKTSVSIHAIMLYSIQVLTSIVTLLTMKGLY